MASAEPSVVSAWGAAPSSVAESSFAGAMERRDWLETPVPLVALLGIEQIHQPIISNLPQKNALRFLSLPLGHSFPKHKTSSHRTNPPFYEGYQPDGILKANWISKHCDVLPAVVTLLFEWDDGDAAGTPTAAAVLQTWEHTVVQAILAFKKDNASREEMRLLLVVVHHHGTTAEDESWINERLHTVAKASGLDSKSTFLLTTVDLKTALRKLEDRLYEMCCDHYRTQSKRVKKLKDKLNKNTQSKLLVRHQFKVAFFAELAGDSVSALKYYNQSYSSLVAWAQKCALDRLAHLEVKLVGYLICFKLIKVLLNAGKVAESIDQFDLHVARLGDGAESGELRGPPELEFTHCAWLAKQFRTFGELLEQTPLALAQMKLSRHRNPGFYFQTAAYFATQRKSAAVTARLSLHTRLGRTSAHSGPAAAGVTPHGDATVTVPPSSLPLPSSPPPPTPLVLLPAAYVGQIELGEESARLAHGDRMAKVVELLRQTEAHFDHSQQIIDLLTRAYEHFKQQRANRMILHIAALMAAEYLHSDNFTMAKKFFDRIAKTYRREGWYSVLTDIVQNAYVCAQRLDLSRDEIEYALELLGPSLCVSAGEREQLHRQLIQLVGRLAASVHSSAWSTVTSDTAVGAVEEGAHVVAPSTSLANLAQPSQASARATASTSAVSGPCGLETGLCGVFHLVPESGPLCIYAAFSPISTAAPSPVPPVPALPPSLSQSLPGTTSTLLSPAPLLLGRPVTSLSFFEGGGVSPVGLSRSDSSPVVTTPQSHSHVGHAHARAHGLGHVPADDPSAAVGVGVAHNDEDMLFSLTLQSCFPLPVRFSKVVLVFNQKVRHSGTLA